VVSDVTVLAPELHRVLSSLSAQLGAMRPAAWASSIFAAGTFAVRWLSRHTGVPALVVAAALVVVGYRILKRTFRFAVEVAVVAVLLAAAIELGFIRW
jgi:hypothetical protein